MKVNKMIGLAVIIVGILLTESWDAWGSSKPTGASFCSPQTLVANPGTGAVAIRGTVAVEVTGGMWDSYGNPSSGDQDVDITLRLTRSGMTNWYRLHLHTRVDGYTNEAVACAFIDPSNYPPGSLNNLAVSAFVSRVLSDFGLSLTASRLVITDNSISNAEPSSADTLIYGTGTPPQHGSTMADITLWAQ